MTRRFTCRGFKGTCRWMPYGGGYFAEVVVSGVRFKAWADTASAAKSRVRRKLDAVERAFRERGRG